MKYMDFHRQARPFCGGDLYLPIQISAASREICEIAFFIDTSGTLSFYALS
jgi:hypothetical protein